MKLYKIRHKPTRLFYQASSSITNLGEGDLWLYKPLPKDCNILQETIRIKTHHLLSESSLCSMTFEHNSKLLVNPYDWEIVEYELVEVIK